MLTLGADKPHRRLYLSSIGTIYFTISCFGQNREPFRYLCLSFQTLYYDNAQEHPSTSYRAYQIRQITPYLPAQHPGVTGYI